MEYCNIPAAGATIAPWGNLKTKGERQMFERHADQENLVRFLALCGISAPIVFAVLVTVGGFIYEGYSHVTQAVSELGGVEARYPLLQNLNFLAVGVLFIAFAIGLHKGVGGGAKLGAVLIGFFGVSSCLGNAVFPCDPGCAFQTFTGTMHNATGLAGFLAAIAGIFLISRSLRTDLRWRTLYHFSWIAGIAVLVSLLLWIGVAKAADVGSLNGVLERVFILCWFVWVEVMAIRLFRNSRRQTILSEASS